MTTDFVTSQPVEVASLTGGLFWLALVNNANNNDPTKPLYTATFDLENPQVSRFAAVAPAPGMPTLHTRVRISRTASDTERLALTYFIPGTAGTALTTAPRPMASDPSLNFDSPQNVLCAQNDTESTEDVAAFGDAPILGSICGTTLAFWWNLTSPFGSLAPATDTRLVELTQGVVLAIAATGPSTNAQLAFITAKQPSGDPGLTAGPSALPIMLGGAFGVDARRSANSTSTLVAIAGLTSDATLETVVVDAASPFVKVGLGFTAGTSSSTVSVATSKDHFLVVYEKTVNTDQVNIVGRLEYGPDHAWTDEITLATSAKSPRVAADLKSGTFVLTYLDDTSSVLTPALVTINCQ